MNTDRRADLLPFQQKLVARLRDLQPVVQKKRARRRRDIRFGALATAVGTAAAVIALLLVPNDLDGGSTAKAPRSSLFLASQVSDAVEDADNKILHTFETSSSPGQPELRFEGWWDQGRGNRTRMVQLDPTGKAMSESIFTMQDDKGVLIAIDRATSTWWTRTRHVEEGKGAIWQPAPATVRFRQEIADGEAQIVGEEKANGLNLLHVRDNSKPGVQRDLWVFLDTYLPVRRITTDEFGNRFEMTFEWLPRTEENLKLLEPDLTGLKQVDPPRAPEPSADGTLG